MRIILSGHVKVSSNIKQCLLRTGYNERDIIEMSLIYYAYRTMNITLEDSALDKYNIFRRHCHYVRESDIELRGGLYGILRRSASRYEILGNINYINRNFIEVELW